MDQDLGKADLRNIGDDRPQSEASMPAAQLHVNRGKVWGDFTRDKRVKIGLVCLLCIAAILRIFITYHYVDLHHPKLWEFGVIARNLYQTGSYSFRVPSISSGYMPPAYPIFIALVYKAFGMGFSAHVTVAIVLLIFEIAIPFLVSWIAYKIWDWKVGAVAFLLSLFWPLFVIMSGRLHCIPMYAAFLIGAYGVLFSGRPFSDRKFMLCGFLLGVYANFRYEAILFLIPIIYYIVRLKVPFPRSRVHKLKAIIILLVSFTILIAPWLGRNYRVFGRFVLSTSSGYNLLRGHHEGATGTGRDPWPAAKINPDAATPIPAMAGLEDLEYKSPEDELIADRFCAQRAMSYIIHNPRRELELLFRKAFYFLIADFTHPVMRMWPIWAPSLLALIAGFFYWLRFGMGDIRQQTLWLLFAMQLLLSMMVFVLLRYRMVVDFVPLIFFSASLVRYLFR